MKLAPIFSHFLDSHTHVERPIPAPQGGHPPVLVFRGLPYKKEQATITTGAQPIGNERLVFRGLSYTKVPATSGLDLPRREKAVRIFRGLVVGQVG